MVLIAIIIDGVSSKVCGLRKQGEGLLERTIKLSQALDQMNLLPSGAGFETLDLDNMGS